MMPRASRPQPAPPLNGVRVLDLSWLLPGPFCTGLLADLGADVVKVERPGDGDYMRDILPGMFRLANRGKRSGVFDLRSDTDHARLLEFAAGADVLVEGFRPGVVARLGVGYEHVKAVNPGIVYVSISGFGQTGPNVMRAGHDVNYAGTAGLLSIPIAGSDGSPSRMPIPATDLSAAMYAAVSILAALRQRDATGVGTYLDVSLSDCALAWSALRWVDGPERPGETWRHTNPGNDVFQAADGVWLAFGLVEEKFWRTFCDLLGAGRNPKVALELPASATTSASVQAELRALIAVEVARFPSAFWLGAAATHDLPVSLLATTFMDLRREPQFVERDMWADGSGSRDLPRFPVHLPGIAQSAEAPSMGSDDTVLRRGPAWSHGHTA
jgi:crotonobetainyl-CoA:carnitine CoA-transferase CaiB-like acyl-CoA transferase